MHIFYGHAAPNISTKTVFSVARKDILPLIDEAFAKGVPTNPQDLWRLEADMGRVIGTKGETKVALIVDPITHRVVSAYPF